MNPLQTPIARIPDLDKSQVADTDSYKLCHFRHLPPGTTGTAGYNVSRGGMFDVCTLFGLQYDLHKYRSEPVTEAQVEYVAEFAPRHGLPFPKDGWLRIARKHRGRLPIRIRAIPEGLVIPTGLPTFTVQSLDPELPWLQGWFETSLMRLWEPSTVAIASREQAKLAKHYLRLTSDDPNVSHLYQVHCFGGRGVTCREQAQVAGGSTLLCFRGSDTLEGIRWANRYYNHPMAGFSIPALEHSVVCAWGREREFDCVENFIRLELLEREVPAGFPKFAACPADTYNVYNFARMVTSGRLLEMIKRSGGTFVSRPDSGNPLEVLPEVLGIMEHNLGTAVRVNRKNFKVLPDYLRIIQGDGINLKMEHDIYEMLIAKGWSTENVTFGSGGANLQSWMRDDQRWKFAGSWAEVNGEERNIRKDPITDPNKRSIAGRLDTIRKDNGDYDYAVLEPGQIAHPQSIMNNVFESGDILWGTDLEECRTRIAV